MNPKRYYYINRDAKQILHYGSEPEAVPEGFEYAGMSQLQPKGAAGYYARNEQGYTVRNGDDIQETPNESERDIVSEA